MPYERKIKRNQRTYVVILIDQSGSMETPMAATGRAKCEEVTDALNRLLLELIRAAAPTGRDIKDYYDVSIFGYNHGVRSLFAGKLAGRDSVSVGELYAAPAAMRQREIVTTDADGNEHRATVHDPVWVTASAMGKTSMAAAFAHALPLLEEWVEENPTSFPPIVINLTDGIPTDEGLHDTVQRIRSLSTADGQVLVFNLHVSAASKDTCRFPVSAEDLPPEGQLLYSISSVLPDVLREQAQGLQMDAPHGCRGLVFNGDVVDITKVLRIGTWA
ncbi:VWA domain-containing protein [Streptomyces lavendulocolor]|uniref:VWA domain-containing protein n=1 Tax=Streptomyces TaxID=1883 RepID=UPI003C30DAAE